MAAQQAMHRPERQAVFHPTPIITQQCNTQHIHPDKGYKYGMHSGFVVVVCVSCPAFFPATESENSRVATITAFSRILLYPWAPSTFAHTPTGPTVAYKPGLCPSTSYSCITNFGYTLTFASRSSDPIISKAADSPIIHHAEPFRSRVTRPRVWHFDTTSPTSTTITILHPSL
ncbi:hypothetical protein EDB83DRAFT_1831274 [Lactarius deliciosus]|nr:hypothetical protein EDB83DRAFT_1831274 [Lactarius deliciosus]